MENAPEFRTAYFSRAEEEALSAEADYYEAQLAGTGYDEQVARPCPTIHELTKG
jgi:hypothetical protein